MVYKLIRKWNTLSICRATFLIPAFHSSAFNLPHFFCSVYRNNKTHNYSWIPILTLTFMISNSLCEDEQSKSNNLIDPNHIRMGLESTVRIIKGRTGGSGTIISKDGFIVTNAHVIGYSKHGSVTVIFSDGTKISGNVHSFDKDSDIALIKIDTTTGSNTVPVPVVPLKFSNSSNIQEGESIITFGSPHNMQNTVTIGIISCPLRYSYEMNIPNSEAYIQADLTTNPGNSGGPLLNNMGEIIGIHCKRHSGGYALAIPSNYVSQIITQLIANKRVIRADFGFTLIEQKRGNSSQNLIVINDVKMNSPAYKCGLKK